MDNTYQLIIWRESVCAGDDCDSPHELILSIGIESLRTITDRILEARYLAQIAGDRATWILQSDDSIGTALAVIAQQWSQPRFLVDPDIDILRYIQLDSKPHLHFRYWCQADPYQVYACLQHNEPLPDRYSREI